MADDTPEPIEPASHPHCPVCNAWLPEGHQHEADERGPETTMPSTGRTVRNVQRQGRVIE